MIPFTVEPKVWTYNDQILNALNYAAWLWGFEWPA